MPEFVTSEAELEAIYGQPAGPAVIKEIDHISEHYRRFIEASPFVVLATSGPERIPALPELPTLTEFRADLDPDGATGNSWHGIFAPAGTPDPIIARLNAEIVKIVKTQDMQERLRAFGLTPTGTCAEHLAKELAANYEYWGKIVRDLNVKVE